MKNLISAGLLWTLIMGPKGVIDVIPIAQGFIVTNLTTGHNTIVARQKNGVIILPDSGDGDFIDTLNERVFPIHVEPEKEQE